MSRSKRPVRQITLIAVVPVIVIGLMLLVWPSKIAQQVENVTVDWRFEARADSDPPADERILVVGIGEKSLAHPSLGRWPWPRTVHAYFLQEAMKRKPQVVVFDILFTEPSNDPVHDQNFVGQMELYPNAITGAAARGKANPFTGDRIGKTEPIPNVTGDLGPLTGFDTGITPIAGIADVAWTGFVNSEPSRVDGIRWHMPLVVRLGSGIYPSLALQSLMRLDNVRAEKVEVDLGEEIRFLDDQGNPTRVIPINEKGELRLSYRSFDSFTRIEYGTLIDQLQVYPEVDWPEQFPPIEGQVLMIGQTAAGLTDFGPTPLLYDTALVLVQATALNNMLQDDYLMVCARWPILLGWLVLTWATLWLLRDSSVIVGVVTALLIAGAYVFAAFWLFETRNLQVPIFLPVGSFLGLHMVTMTDRLLHEVRSKTRIKSMFGTYVSPEMVDELVARDELPELGGHTAEITAFFSDIQGFSELGEALSPEQLVQVLNEYLGPLTDIITENGGGLDKYIGDAIVAMFNAPIDLADHAYRACRASVEIHRVQADLRERWKKEGVWPECVCRMQTRIGLNTGEAVVGNMGSARRFDYTMMGDSVNLAARCESGAKTYGVYSMITEMTRDKSREVADDIEFRFLDQLIVKGREKTTKMYEIMGFKGELSEETVDCIGIYNEAIEKYFHRDWEGALEMFKRSAELEPYQPGDPELKIYTNPSLVMAARCPVLMERSLDETWNGVYKMTSK